MMSSNMAYHDETSSLMSSWQHIGVHGDMTMLGSPETHRSGSPGSQASQSPIILSGESTPFGENPSYSKNSAYPESLSSSSCSISMATSSTPDSGSDMCSLVDEEFLKHYRVREIMDSLQHSGNYTTAQSAMLAASAYYDYYDPYSGPGSMNDVGYHGSPDIKMGIEELCPICGDKVSGYHYGLQTCESCKGFFKRTVQNKKVYSCVDNRNCMIDKTQRKRCPYCRFQKCISVGMKLEAVRADRMRGGRNKFGPMYKRDRALKQQAVRQRQQMFAQMQYQMQFNVNGLAGPGMPPGMMDGFGPMCPPDIKPNIAMLGLHPPPTNGSPPGPMGPAGNMMGHPYHRPMLPMNSHHDGHLSPNSHHLPPPPTSLHSSHPGSYLPHGPPPPHHNSQYHPHPHMMSSMNSQHGPPFGHQGPSHGSNSVSGASGMPPPHHPPHSLLNLSDMSSSSSSHTDTNSHGGAPPNTQHTTSGGPLVNSQHHHGGNNHQGNHNSGDIVSMATGVPSIPSPGPNSGVPQLIQDMQKNEPDPFEVRQKLSQIAEMMLQQQGASLLQDTAGVLADGTCEINKPMLQLVCRVCDQALFLLVEWARGAFFFRDLRVEDQMKLLQNCWSELLIFDFVFKQMAHSKHRHLLLGTGHMVSIDTLDSVGLSDVKERLVDLAAKFRDLKLDHNEFTCLKFLILLNPDVVGLVNRPQVEDYQKKVNMVLLDYTSNFYPAIHDKFGQLLVRLPEIRLFSLRAEDYLYFQHISGNIPENTLLMEMLHSKRK